MFPKLLTALFSAGQASTNLEGQQALAKQLADILAFVLRFDDAKMVNPAIQNDFSYYRRSLNKQKNKVEVKIKDELANRMSLFFAYPTPMLKVRYTLWINDLILNVRSSLIPLWTWLRRTLSIRPT